MPVGLSADLCPCHEQLKQYEQAEAWRRKWLPVVKEKHGPESSGYASRSWRGSGRTLLQQKKYADAEPILRECLAILQKKRAGGLGDVPHPVAARRRPAGPAEVRRGRAASRSRLSGDEKVGEGAREHKHYGSTPRQCLTEALERLVQLYDAWGKPDEAAKWRKELEALEGRRTAREAKRQVSARYSV